MADAVLVLEDGRTFLGSAYGATGSTVGEAVFCTAMTGYQETLTDPSYHRQVVVMTAPHIGNTGWNDEDDESSRIWVAGYVVRDPARRSSSWRAARDLADELVAQGVVGISDVDTRALTRHLRERGAMRAGIFSGDAVTTDAEMLAVVQGAPSMAGADLAGEVTTREAYVVPAVGEKRFTVAAIDLGIKGMTPALMAERGIEVHVLPATATVADVMAVAPGRGVRLERPGRPGRHHRGGRPPRGRARPAHPLVRDLLRQPAARTRPRPRHLQARPTATGASTSRCSTAPPARSRSPRTTTASRCGPPRAPTTARRSTPRTGRRGSRTSASTTASSRAWSASTSRPSRCSTTPRPPPDRTTPPTCSTASST